jgi:hypothetical protein
VACVGGTGPFDKEWRNKYMKKYTLALVMAGFGMVNAAFAAPTDSAEKVVNISSAVIPSGFDNSEPMAIVSGLFPNSCYAWDRSEVKHVSNTLHEVRSIAKVRQGMCLMVMLPFSEEVMLGKFESGEHTLRFVNGDGTYLEKRLSVD